MKLMFSCCVNKRMDGVEELTDAEKEYTRKMCGLVEKNTPLNEAFFKNMNNTQIKYLLSIVNMQDAQSSHSYATYVRRLHELADEKKIDKIFFR